MLVDDAFGGGKYVDKVCYSPGVPPQRDEQEHVQPETIARAFAVEMYKRTWKHERSAKHAETRMSHDRILSINCTNLARPGIPDGDFKVLPTLIQGKYG